MTAQNFTLFLLTYFLVASCIGISALLVSKNRLLSIVVSVLSLIGLILSAIIGSLVVTGENFVVGMFSQLMAFSRTYVAAFGLGLSCALPIALLWFRQDNRALQASAVVFLIFGILGTLLFGGLSAGKDALSPYLPHPDTEVEAEGMKGLVADGFVLEDFVDTEMIPIRVAVAPNGRIFVSGHTGIAAQAGVVAELVMGENGQYSERVVARHLNHPYGLVATNDRLYVSRSGQYAKFDHGKVEHIATGAVTMLTDTDGDGTMDYYHDIVPNLPGAQGPDHLHQNNDLALSANGELFITTAMHTDGHPPKSDWEGVILKASGEDFENVEVYARGLRNPFGLEFDAAGELWVTDNDPQTGILGGNMGDKLLHVTKGAFFGHPFGHEGMAGVSPHALRSKFALGGLTLASSANLPEVYRNQLFIVVYGEGRIMKIDFSKDQNGEYKAELIPFATVPGAVDIAAAPDGSFIVAVYPDKVVRIRPSKAGK